MSTNAKPAKSVIRSADYREFVATNFGIRMNDNLCEVAFAFQTAHDEAEIIQEQGKVILTPRSLKTLSIFLAEVINRFEAEKGAIPMKEGKAEQIKGIVDKAIPKSKTATAKEAAG